MRRRRRFLPTDVQFITVRTNEQRFALDPYSSPNAWFEVDGQQVDVETRIAMRDRGRKCVETTADLVAAIALNEANPDQPRPIVPFATFTDSIPNIIGAVIARAVHRYNVHLFGVMCMSNHIHFLLQAPLGNLAEFMGYVNGQIAANVNRFHGRSGPFWGRRYAAAPVLDEAEERDKLTYILTNPQNAGLASTMEDWPGLSSAPFLLNNEEHRYLCFDRTSWHNKGCPDNIAPFLSTVKLEHTLLPQFQGLVKESPEPMLAELADAKVNPESEASRKEDEHSSISISPQITLQTAIPTDRPESAKRNPRKRSPQPLCHTTNPVFRAIYQEWYGEFKSAYDEASKQYRSGNINVEFPPGSFAPSKYPLARYSLDPNPKLNPTRQNLECAANELMLAH